MVYLNQDYLRPKSMTPTYPPYHQGEYLEEYFYSHYNQLETKPEREYLDIFWSNIFCNKIWAGQPYPDLQNLLYIGFRQRRGQRRRLQCGRYTGVHRC